MILKDLKEGIWCIRKIKWGMHHKYEGDKLEEVPDIMIRASFEPYRNKIYKKLYKKEIDGECVDLTAKEIIDLIFSCLKKK